MATTIQPAQLWQFARPGTGTPQRSEEVRNNFNAVGRLFYTEDADFPATPRNGMPRVIAQDPNNVRFQVWYNNAWRTLFQNLQRGIPAPTQLIATVSPAQQVWTIDHNLGVKPIVQVFDPIGNQLEPVSHTSPPRSVLPGSHVPPAVLTSLPVGPTVLFEWPATYRGSVQDLAVMVAEDITGSPDFTVDFAVNGTPATGGDVTVSSTQPLGTRLSGGAPSAGGFFEVGDTVTVRITMNTQPTGGALNFSLDTQRALRTGEFTMQHVTDNRVVVTHPAQQAGFATIMG